MKFRLFAFAAALFVVATALLVPVVAKWPLSEAAAAPVVVVPARAAVVVARPVPPATKPANPLTVVTPHSSPVSLACQQPRCARNVVGRCICE